MTLNGGDCLTDSSVPTFQLWHVFLFLKSFSPDFLIDLRLYSNSQPVVSYLALSQFLFASRYHSRLLRPPSPVVLSFFGHHGRHGFGRGGGCHRDLSRASGVAQKWGDSPRNLVGSFRNGKKWWEKPWFMAHKLRPSSYRLTRLGL